MNFRRLLSAASFVLLATATACGPAEFAPGGADNPPPRSHTSSPIIGGTTDNSDPAVVLVAYTNFICTGTVIAPRVVLTAGHCTVVDDTCVPPNCSALSPGGYQIAGGATPFTTGADWLGTVAEVHPNPGYDGNQLKHDNGILILTADAPVTPLGWEDTATPYNPGQQFKAVGYGLANAPTGPDTSGTKRTVTMSISQVIADSFSYGGATQNTCSGDSGGPAIVNGKVIGTVSYGDQNCAQIGVDMRTDFEKAFIGQYASPGGTTTTGTKKKHGCSVDGSASPASALSIAAAFGAFAVVVSRRRRAA
ncbi:MAG TPA: trypsin-like serine protease [bacterium]|nr:trypsin-like serine protease [bacterium]